MNRELIQKEAKEILDKFADALGKVKTEEDFHVDREEFERKDGMNKPCEGLKEDILKNAPNKNKDFIIAEKRSWK